MFQKDQYKLDYNVVLGAQYFCLGKGLLPWN